MIKWLLSGILLITIQPMLAHASQIVTTPTMQEWYQHVKLTAKKYKLDPNLCAALAAGESGIGNQIVRFGPVCDGKFYAPYNIYRGALKKWDIADWRVNTEVGIMLLANKLEDHNNNLRAALRTYNTGDKGKKFDAYVNNIKRLQKWFKEKKTFEDPPNSGRCQMTKH